MVLLIEMMSLKVAAQNITYEYKWYKYYEPVEGKIIGTLPHINRWNTAEKFKELRYRWGFSHILFGVGLGYYKMVMAKQSGYEPSTNIMMSIEPSAYTEASIYDPCWAYYIDEPADREIPFNSVLDIRIWLQANFPNSLFAISGYKRNSDLKNYTNLLSDKVLFSSYKHWWEFLGFWISVPIDPDQRPDWSDMRSLFGDKFSMTWMSANADMSSYEELIGHAKNLGLQGLWLYQDMFGTEVDDANLDRFCTAAAYEGFLQAKFQQVRDEYVDGNFSSRQFVGPEYSSIPPTFDHSNVSLKSITVDNNRIDNYFASTKLSAGEPNYFIVPENKSSTFNSNNEIILKPGFHSENGSYFRAYISKE